MSRKTPDYSLTKIYKLIDVSGDDASIAVYVGHTTRKKLHHRLDYHKYDAKKHPNRKVYAHCLAVGWEHIKIILIEKYPCADKEEAVAREQYWMDELNPRLNMFRALGGKCEHNHIRSKCKECGGGSICEHNRIRSKCKECGGGSICEHNRRRDRCKECGGGSICEHNRERSRCKECGGGSICEHNRQRSHCKECSGSQICEHSHVRATCKDCDGRAVQKIQCPCGVTVQRQAIRRHERSQKHQKWLAAAAEAEEAANTETFD